MNIVKALFLTLLSITAFSVQSKQINTSNNSIEMKRVFNSNGTGQAGKGTTLSAVSASSATVTYTPPRPHIGSVLVIVVIVIVDLIVNFVNAKV